MDARTTIDFPSKSRAGWLGLLILLCGAAAAAWWYYHDHPTPVVVVPAATGDIDVTVNALGTVTSPATVTIKSQISGYLVNVAYREGQAVKKGDLLADIDDRPYKLALQNAEGVLARDQAMLRSAELELDRYQDLAKTNAIPRQQLDQQVAKVEQDKANIMATILSDQAQVEIQKRNIGYCHVVAPVNGRVGLRLVDPGNYVTPGDDTGLVVITQLQPATVIFPVAENDLPRITARINAAKTLPVIALDRSGAKKLGDGQLNQINTTPGVVELRAEFANADEALFPNQFVNVRLLVDTLKGVTVVPQAAIRRSASGAFVYRLNKDQTVTALKVKLGPSSGEQVVIEEGLSPGDRVVIDGADTLHDGAKVVPRDTNGALLAGDPPVSGAMQAPPQTGDRRDGGGNGQHHRGGDQQ